MRLRNSMYKVLGISVFFGVYALRLWDVQV